MKHQYDCSNSCDTGIPSQVLFAAFLLGLLGLASGACTASQGAIWRPEVRPSGAIEKLEEGVKHSADAVILAEAVEPRKLYWSEDGLEVVAHLFEAGCRRAIALDASGTAALRRPIGACGEEWLAPLGPDRGLVLRDGSLVIRDSGATGSYELPEISGEVLDADLKRNLIIHRCGERICVFDLRRRTSREIPGDDARFGVDGILVARHGPRYTTFYRGEKPLFSSEVPVRRWAPLAGGVVYSSGEKLHFVDAIGNVTLLEQPIAELAASGTPEPQVAAALEDGRLVSISLGPLVGRTASRSARWHERVAWLAAPERLGRLSGSPEERQIVEWLEGELRAAGLDPTRHRFDLPRLEGARVVLKIDGDTIEDGFAPLPTYDAFTARGPVGSAPTLADVGSDPRLTLTRLPGDWRAIHNARGELAAGEHGAIFLESTELTRFIDAPIERQIPAGGPPMIVVSPDLAQRLAEASEVYLDYQPSVALGKGTTVVATVGATGREVGEIVVTAHYDHIGSGGFGSRDAFDVRDFPGSDDNASGVASLLVLAEELASDPLEHYDVTFLLTGGEEAGLVGSRAWVDEERTRETAPALVINFDMMGRLGDARFFGSDNLPQEWLDHLETASFAAGWPLVEVAPLDRGGISDHMPFVRRFGTPALFVSSVDEAHWHRDERRPEAHNSMAALRATHLIELWMLMIDESTGRDRRDRGDAGSE